MLRWWLLPLLPSLSTMHCPIQGWACCQHPPVLAVIAALIDTQRQSPLFLCIPTERMPTTTVQGNTTPQVHLVATAIASSRHCRCDPPPPHVMHIIAANLHQIGKLQCITNWPSHNVHCRSHSALLCLPPHHGNCCRRWCADVAAVTLSKQWSPSQQHCCHCPHWCCCLGGDKNSSSLLSPLPASHCLPHLLIVKWYGASVGGSKLLKSNNINLISWWPIMSFGHCIKKYKCNTETTHPCVILIV